MFEQDKDGLCRFTETFDIEALVPRASPIVKEVLKRGTPELPGQGPKEIQRNKNLLVSWLMVSPLKILLHKLYVV